MVKSRDVSNWILAGLLCAVAGCVSQTEYDAVAKANLQLQDKLATSQADKVKTRTQVALLRQELVQARQAQQDSNDRLDSLTVEADTLRARLDLHARRPARPAAQSQPAATQPAH